MHTPMTAAERRIADELCVEIKLLLCDRSLAEALAIVRACNAYLRNEQAEAEQIMVH